MYVCTVFNERVKYASADINWKKVVWRGCALSLQQVISQYSLEEIIDVQPISVGLIHQTFALHTVSKETYILQGLHHKLSSDEILSDYEAVTTHLAQEKYGGPQLIKTRGGGRCAEGDQLRWRLSTFVPGETLTELTSELTAYIGGKALAEFHQVMSTINYHFQSTHPGHDTEGHLARLVAASEKSEYQVHWSEIREIGTHIIEALSKSLFPADLKRQVVHGDPKISNLRFTEGHAVMIDLDTCNLHTRLVDLGDAVRSWCHRPRSALGERFCIHTWQAMVRGYLERATPLDELEREWLPKAGYVITLELASRFARDYLEDDYFAYDEINFSSRRAHNQHRLKTMWILAEEMRQAEPNLVKFLRSLA